ncbi:MAG: hypothetical protein WBB32_15405 [Flavobacteriales bacterium]
MLRHSILVFGLLIGFALVAQSQDHQFQVEVQTAVSGMTLAGTPRTNLTTPINDIAFRYEINGMWTSKKDSIWGTPWAFGGAFSILHWGAETIYPIYFQISCRPLRNLASLRLDGRIGGTLGPWKETPDGPVNLTFSSEVGVGYELLVLPKWSVKLRIHAGFLESFNSLKVSDEGQWTESGNTIFKYAGIGLGVSF